MASQGQKKALLVGITYGTEVRGAVNDIHKIKHHLLSQRFGFTENNVTVLADERIDGLEGNIAAPTGRNIWTGLIQLLQGSGPNDVLVFAFSGLGTQVKLDPASSVFDDALIPVDGNVIFEKQIQALITRLLHRTANLTVLADYCHSAPYSFTRNTGTVDHLDFFGGSAQERERAMVVRCVRPDAAPKFIKGLDTAQQGLTDWTAEIPAGPAAGGQAIYINACKAEHEKTAIELFVQDGYRRHGAMTWALLTVLRDLPGEISYPDLIKEMRRQVHLLGTEPRLNADARSQSQEAAQLADQQPTLVWQGGDDSAQKFLAPLALGEVNAETGKEPTRPTTLADVRIVSAQLYADTANGQKTSERLGAVVTQQLQKLWDKHARPKWVLFPTEAKKYMENWKPLFPTAVVKMTYRIEGAHPPVSENLVFDLFLGETLNFSALETSAGRNFPSRVLIANEAAPNNNNNNNARPQPQPQPVALAAAVVQAVPYYRPPAFGRAPSQPVLMRGPSQHGLPLQMAPVPVPVPVPVVYHSPSPQSPQMLSPLGGGNALPGVAANVPPPGQRRPVVIPSIFGAYARH